MSWQAKIVKKLLPRQFSNWSAGTIEEQRARQERTARFARAPADIQYQPVDAGGIPAEWIGSPDMDIGVILYLHGGAYTLGSIDTHREFNARLVRTTNLRSLVINYRLAPEHPYPAALEDAIAAYCWLLTQGFASSQIALAGDSAGGGWPWQRCLPYVMPESRSPLELSAFLPGRIWLSPAHPYGAKPKLTIFLTQIALRCTPGTMPVMMRLHPH